MFCRFIRFDIRGGILRYWKKYMIAALFFIFCGIVAHFSTMNDALGNPAIGSYTMTLGDFILYPFTGMEKFTYEDGNPFQFPAVWLFAMLLITFITLYYPYNDLNEMGKHVLLLSADRKRWWYAKCVWVALSVSVYFFIAYLMEMICAVIAKAELTLHVNNFVAYFYGFNAREMEAEQLLAHSDWSMATFMLSIPLCVLSICLLQMLLSLIIKPLFSYLVTAVILFAGAYFQSPFLIGNYAMVARSSLVVTGGVQVIHGVLLSLLVILFVVVLGRLYFKNMDII